MWEEVWFSISIREITFREQELNWLFAKYKRLENNPLYGTWQLALVLVPVYFIKHSVSCYIYYE